MRRRLVLLAVLALASLLAGSAAQAPAAGTAKAKVKCHWVKATKKRKRHKVCVKVKKKAPAKSPSASTTRPPSTTAPASSPAPAPPATVPATGVPGAPSAAPDPDPATPAPDPTTPVAARLQATTREWSITLSRPTLPAGSTILQLVNRGEDAHDLHVRPGAGGADVLAIGSTESGQVSDTSGTLPAGTYTLYCSLPGHEAAGMHATLTVQ